METIERLKTEKWYTSQMFLRKEGELFKCVYLVVFANSTGEAMQKSKDWARQEYPHWNLEDEEINLYLKNYKLEAKDRIKQGLWV